MTYTLVWKVRGNGALSWVEDKLKNYPDVNVTRIPPEDKLMGTYFFVAKAPTEAQYNRLTMGLIFIPGVEVLFDS